MKISQLRSRRGFLATTSLLVLALGALVFALVVLNVAATYSDQVYRHEWRLQAGLNLHSCLETMTIIYAKDFLISREVSLPEFNCLAGVKKINATQVEINATSTLADIRMHEKRMLSVSDSSVLVR